MFKRLYKIFNFKKEEIKWLGQWILNIKILKIYGLVKSVEMINIIYLLSIMILKVSISLEYVMCVNIKEKLKKMILKHKKIYKDNFY